MPQPHLSTSRLLLRPFENSDAEQVQSLVNNPLIADVTAQIPHPYSLGMAQQWIATYPINPWLLAEGYWP